MTNKSLLLIVGALFLMGATGCGTEDSESAVSDDPAQRVAARVMEALGGQEAWDKTRHIHFTFAGRRTHDWDKWTGRHRLEGETREGQKYVVLHNINTREGEAYLDGQKQTGEELKKSLDNAYSAWINDTYWLVMPYKLRDPGVNLTHAGEETLNGQPYDVLQLSFDQVGLTPGDRYWAYINRETGLMDRWAYHLQSMGEDDPRTVWDWKGWQKYGQIQLAPDRIQVDSGRQLPLGEIVVSQDQPDELYTRP